MKLITTILTLTSLASFAGQGGMGSGGGASVVCRDTAGKIITAEALDLYEGRTRYGLTLKQPLGDYRQEFVRYNREMNNVGGFPVPPQIVLEGLDQLVLKLNFLPVGMKQELTNDYGDLYLELPENCKLEQLAIYHDKKNRIDIDSEVWNATDDMNKAAILAHEEIYRSLRRTEEPTSELTRKVIAMLFSTTPPAYQLTDMPKKETQVCFGHKGKGSIRTNENGSVTSSSGDMFFMYPSQKNPGHTIIRIQSLARSIFGRTEVEVPQPIVTELLRQTPMTATEMPYMFVDDVYANTNLLLPVQSELFGNDKIIVNYKFGEKFYLSYVRNGKQVIARSFISSCYPYSQVITD